MTLCARSGRWRPRATVRIAWGGTLGQVRRSWTSREGRVNQARSGEQITWAMTLGCHVGFRWWLQRSGGDSF